MPYQGFWTEGLIGSPDNMNAGLLQRDIFANRPAAALAGVAFIASDIVDETLYRDNGSTWDTIGAFVTSAAQTFAGAKTFSSGIISTVDNQNPASIIYAALATHYFRATSTNANIVVGVAGRPVNNTGNSNNWTATVGLRGVMGIPFTSAGGNPSGVVTGAAALYGADAEAPPGTLTIQDQYSCYLEIPTRGTRINTGLLVSGGATHAIHSVSGTNKFVGAILGATGAGFILSSGAIAVQEAFTLSSTAGDITISPASNLVIDERVNIQKSVSGSPIILYLENQNTASGSDAYLWIDTNATGGECDPRIRFTNVANNTMFGMDVSNSHAWVFSDDFDLGTNDRLRLAKATGILDVDGTSGLTASVVGLFDDLEDAQVLQRWMHGDAGWIDPEETRLNRQLMFDRGILIPKDPDKNPNDPNGYFISVQPVLRLLAGAGYQGWWRDIALQEEIEQLKEQITQMRCSGILGKIREIANKLVRMNNGNS